MWARSSLSGPAHVVTSEHMAEVGGAAEFDRMLDLLRALAEEDVEYVLVGGVAMNLHGIIRATEDVDFFIRSEESNVERLRKALQRVWHDPDIEEIRAADLAGPYPTIRYGPPGEEIVIDLIGRLGTAVRYEDLAFQTVTIEGVRVRLATPETLYRMKLGTVRPIDHADAVSLKEKFRLEDK